MDAGDAWSSYLRRMIARRGWTVARLAREAGVHRSAIFKWLSEGSDGITLRSVYLIADALGEDRAVALRAAGNLPPERDYEVDRILAAPNKTEREKAALIERIMDRRAAEQAQRIADLELMLGQNDPDPDRTGA